MAEHSLLGYIATLFGIDVDTSAPRGRTLDGGTFVPRGDSSGEGRAAHGPLHPAVNRALETWMAPLVVFLLWSWFCHLVDCIVFLSLGFVACMVFEPFKPRPVFGSCMCPSSFFFVWLVLSTPCFLLFFFFLRRWGNPNPLRGVWGSPCVSSSRPSTTTSIRSSSFSPSPRFPPRLVFFFLVGVRVGVSLVFFSLLCLSVWWSVLGFFGGSSALHARCIMHSLFGGRETIISPLPFIITATVLSHSVCSRMFVPPRGKCCPFFSFCVFCAWFRVFCRFLSFFSS